MRVKTKKSKKTLLIAIIALFVIAGGIAVYAYRDTLFDTPSTNNSQEDEEQEPSDSTESEQTPDREQEGEGSTIIVPDDVSPDRTPNTELIVSNREFKITRYDGTYTITLYAIINNPSQYEWYQDQLREYKQNALQYLKNQGVNTETAKIIYEPDEAENL